MTPFNEMTDKAQIERMLKEGKLTPDEARRLQMSLDQQAERTAVCAEAVAQRYGFRRRFGILFGACVVMLVLGALTTWMLIPAGTPPPVPATGSHTAERVVDLSALSEERRTSMKQSLKLSTFTAVALIAAVVGGVLMFLYNGLIDSRERVNAAWAQVENVYQRRLDLVPVLIDGVKTYMDHERATLEALTEARAEAAGVQAALRSQGPDSVEQMKALEAAQGHVESALARLFAVVENYPDLRASQNFLNLQDQIEGTENRVTTERRRYNEFSRLYNSRILKFPYNIIAAAMDFEHKPYFQAEERALEGLQDPFGRGRQSSAH